MSVDWDAHLEPGEELKWSGVPRVGKIAATTHEACVVVLLWSIVIFLLVVAGMQDTTATVVIAVFALFASFVTWRTQSDLHDKRMQAYAVTNRRVLMCYDIEDGRLYETMLTRKTRVLLVGWTVSVDAGRGFLPGGFAAQGAHSTRTKGLALHSLEDPLEAIRAMREAVRAMPKDA